MAPIPSAVTPREVAALQTLAKGKKVLEVGALLGYSTVKLARFAKVVYSVDPHYGYPRANPRPTHQQFLANLEHFGVRDKVVPIMATHTIAFDGLATGQFDGVFIDCTGEYDLTRDVMLGAKRLLRHCGWMAVHDCGHPDWPGALEAVESFNRPFDLVDRLAIIHGTWS